MALALLGLNLAGVGPAYAAEEPVLRILTLKTEQTVTKTDLEKRLKPVEITVYSPVYQRPMTYQGFWLDDILSAFQVHLSDEEDLVFQCQDGYGTSMPGSDIGRQKWLVAYGEPQGWTLLPERHQPTTPGPWYVVGREPGSYQEFPWPYQVIALKIRSNW